MSNFEQFFRASLGHSVQVWVIQSWRAILNSFWKHDTSLDSVQNVSIDAALRHLTLAEKVADVNPTDLDPKTRPVKTARFLVYDPFAT